MDNEIIVIKITRYIKKISILTEIVNHYAPAMYNYRLLYKAHTHKDISKVLEYRTVLRLSTDPDEKYIYQQVDGIKKLITELEELLQENNIESYPDLKQSANEVINKANISINKFIDNIEFIKNEWFKEHNEEG